MAVPAYPADAEPKAPARSRAAEPDVETCTITRWRGYVSSSFIALLDDGTPVAESGTFRPSGRADPPDAGSARVAFDELRAELQRLGWDASDDRVGAWYAARFSRPIASPAALLQPALPRIEPPVEAEPPPREEPPQIPPAAQRVLEAPRRRMPPPVEAEPRPREEPTELAPAGQKAAVAPQGRIEPPVKAEARPSKEPTHLQQGAGAAPPSRRIVVVSTLGIAAALGLGAYLALGTNGRHASVSPTAPAAVPAPTRSAAAPKLPAAQPKAPAPQPKHAAHVSTAAAPTVRLSITANDRASWLEIRRGSASGRVLFTGELAAGRHLHLTGKRLWARFGAARNLTISANGRPLEFTGTYEYLFVAAKK
jgi:Domain of unknown function (DUF4115)